MKKREKDWLRGWVRFYLGALIWVVFGSGASDAAILVWSPNASEEEIVYYTVYIDSVLGSSQSNVTEPSFSLSHLPLEITFALRVTATSKNGLESAPSSPIDYVGVTPIAVPPSITVQPGNKFVASGAPLTLNVQVSGTPPFRFQWMWEGTPLPRETNAVLSVNPVTWEDAGTYSVEVSNSFGSVVSTGATVTVQAPLSISSQPEGTTVLAGSPFSLRVEAHGTQPYFYQWFKDGVAVPGGTAANPFFPSASPDQSGVYYVVVTNLVGSAQSANAVVRVIPHIAITQQPLSQTIAPGAPLTVSVQASSALPLFYRWFLNDEELLGQSGPFIHIEHARSEDAGTYYAELRNDMEITSSGTAVISVVLDPDTSRGHLSITTTAGNLILTGHGEPGATYNIQRSDNLSAPDWTTIQSVVADPGGYFEIVVPSSGQNWFMRTSRQ